MTELLDMHTCMYLKISYMIFKGVILKAMNEKLLRLRYQLLHGITILFYSCVIGLLLSSQFWQEPEMFLQMIAVPSPNSESTQIPDSLYFSVLFFLDSV